MIKNDKFIGTVHTKYPNLCIHSVSNKKYRTAKIYNIYCSKCADDTELFGDGLFAQTKSNFDSGKIPCGCNKSHKFTKEQFTILINRKCVFDGNYTKLLTIGEDDINRKSIISLKCAYHGIFKSDIDKILNRSSRCPKCSLKYKPTTKEFEQIISKIHPTIKILGEYINKDSKIFCRCLECGNEWSPIANNLKRNIGCPDCSKYGFKNTNTAYLYIFKSDCGTIKIGKTNESVKGRLLRQSKTSGKNFNIEYLFKFDSGRHASIIENLALSHFRKIFKNPSEKCDGYTEMFINADLAQIKYYIENLMHSYRLSQ